MATIVKRVVGALLALVGLALTVVGVWFAAQLGTSGTAEFAVHPATADPVLIGPDVLNRVDADVVVTATPTAGGSVWMALANPSDADAVVGDSKHVAVTGVSVTRLVARHHDDRHGHRPRARRRRPVAPAGRRQGPGDAHRAAVRRPRDARRQDRRAASSSSLTLTVTDKSWFVEAVVAALIGLFLLVAGVVLLTARRRRHHGAVEVPPVPEAGRAGNHRPRPGRWSRGRDRPARLRSTPPRCAARGPDDR